MKKIFKNLINLFIKFGVNTLGKINSGRYILDNIKQNIIARKKTVICKDFNLTFYVPNRLSYYRVDTFHSKEPETLEWVDNFKKESVFWDIGANIGIYSCYAAKKSFSKVYAFEPSIFNLEWLGKNIFLNNLFEKITVIPISLNDKKEESALNFSSTDWSGALSTFAQNYNYKGKDFKKVFKLKTLGMGMDDIKNLLNISQPDYIKLDVDGIEHLILKGGKEVISNTKEILVEVNEKFNDQSENCAKTLKQLGFSLKEKSRSGLFENTDFSSCYNQIWIK